MKTNQEIRDLENSDTGENGQTESTSNNNIDI